MNRMQVRFFPIIAQRYLADSSGLDSNNETSELQNSMLVSTAINLTSDFLFLCFHISSHIYLIYSLFLHLCLLFRSLLPLSSKLLRKLSDLFKQDQNEMLGEVHTLKPQCGAYRN